VNLLELRRVGWVVAHPPREEGFFLSGNEIITAAELQLEAANGVEDTPFVTVSVTLTEDNKVLAYGYQVSKMCMEMAAEGALGLSHNLGTCSVNPPFSAIMEGKETKEVGFDFLLH
jgi:nuclear protein localization family protein 4